MIDPRDVEQAQKRMEWIIGFMIIRYHFVYQILSMTVKRCIPEFPTMGVKIIGGGQFELVYGAEFVNNLKDEALTYVLYHEILHIALHHCTSRRLDDHQIGNIATDLAVNELIPISPGSCEPPKNPDGTICGVLVSEMKNQEEFSDIREKQTAEWYYDYLQKKRKQAENKGSGKTGNTGNTGKTENEDSRVFDNHDGWKQDEIADEKVRAKIDEIDKNNLWGYIEGSEKELILAAQQRRINWRNILRQFYGNQAWYERESTRKRPNRRTGYIHPGERKLQLDRHLVAVDTSGSIDSDLLGQFLATINQMTEYVPIDIMQCDCGVTDTPHPFDRRKSQYEFKGRGGTNFQPIMDVVNERRYKSVVILTDGAADVCSKPSNARVVWVLPEGLNPPVDWGLKIHMSRYT